MVLVSSMAGCMVRGVLLLVLAHRWAGPGQEVAGCGAVGPGASVSLLVGGAMPLGVTRAAVSLLVGGASFWHGWLWGLGCMS